MFLEREFPPSSFGDRLLRAIGRRRSPPQPSSVWVYHRVHPSAKDDNPFDLKVAPDELWDQWNKLKKQKKVVFVDELIDEHGVNHPSSVVALTFDDGYEDNFHHLFPIIRDLDLPVSIFLNTDWLDGFGWRLCDMLNYCVEHGSLNRSELLMTAWRLHHLKPTESWGLAQRLWCEGLPKSPPSGLEDKGMASLQVQEMANSGLVRFEAHGHEHLCYSQVSDADIVLDLEENIKIIEQLTGRRPKGMAYPFGRMEDVQPACLSILENMNLKWGFLASNGHQTPHTRLSLLDRRSPPVL